MERRKASTQAPRPQVKIINAGKKRGAGFDAGSSDRLLWDWDWTILTTDELIRRNLRKMRARARAMEFNNDYVLGFLNEMVANVIGHEGIQLHPKCKNTDGTPDVKANKLIKESWRLWGMMENCTVTTKHSWHEAQKLIMRTLCRDGECLIRKVPGYKNEFSFAIQLIMPDALDEQYIRELPNGNRIICGVEYDIWRKPVRYYLRKNYTFQQFYYAEFTGIGAHEIIDADDIIHLYMPYRIDQTRGIPWIHAAQTRLHMIGAYEEAHLVAARIGASKFVILEKEGGEDLAEAGLAEKTDNGEFLGDVEAGSTWNLPPGVKVKSFDPNFPQETFPDFMRAMLRGISVGMNISYTGLSNDYENVNYSSIRAGLLKEREIYKMLQKFFYEYVHTTIYNEWLKFALLTDSLKKLSPANYPKYKLGASFHGRRWDWVDPQKDLAAKETELELGLTNRQKIMNEMGNGDVEDNMDQLAYENELSEEKGLLLHKIPWEAAVNPNQPGKALNPLPPDDPDNPEGGPAQPAAPAKPAPKAPPAASTSTQTESTKI